MSADASIRRLQHELIAAVREPIFGDSRRRTELPPRAGAISEDFRRLAEAHITPSARLASVQRLELYHRQYWYRILDSLEEDFPALRAFLGAPLFGTIIEHYVEHTPERSFTLRHSGAHLAAHLEANPRLVRDDAASMTGGDRAAIAADLARLEYALCLAFEAGEGDPVPAERLETSAVALQPHVFLLELNSPALELWRAVERGEPLAPPRRSTRRRRHGVVVYREGFILRAERLTRTQYAILQHLEASGSLTSTLEAVAASEHGRACTPHNLAKWFRVWMRLGFFRHRPLQHLTSPESRS
jgi:hypothetical protein